MTTVAKGNIRIYACGGAAINIAGQLAEQAIDPNVLANFNITLIDTSRSNLQKGSSGKIAELDCYLIENLNEFGDLDGSGAVRSENNVAIAARIKDILQQHAPGDMCIVLSSGAGGTGSVVAPLLVSELLERKVPVVAMMVGATSSLIRVKNTLNTFKSYAAIAKLRNAGLVLQYLENSETMPPAKVDNQVVSNILYLCVLFSRQNHGLDSMDLENWLRFNKEHVTTYGPQVAALTTIITEAGDPKVNQFVEKLGNVISVATLAPANTNTDLAAMPEYQTVGRLPDLTDNGVGPNVLLNKTINYIVSDGVLPEYMTNLNKLIKSMTEAQDARVVKNNILTADDKPSANGLVL